MKLKNKNWDVWMIYYYLKSGVTALAFILTPLNFMLLSYNFSNIHNYISIYQFAFSLVVIGIAPLTFLGRYSWRKGEFRKGIDAGVNNNPWIGDHAKSWELFLDGDTEGSKKIMEKYKDCGGKK